MSTPLVSDPNLDVCPDFSSEEYQAARLAIRSLNEGITAEQAAASLADAWKAQNDVAKQRWQQQVNNLREKEADDARRAKEAEDKCIAAEREELEAAEKEDRRKNRAKHLPIQQMKKMEYVAMWHFTDEGLSKTVHPVGSLASKTLTMSQDEEGNMILVPTIDARASNSAVKDKDLSWDQFAVGSLRMVSVMEEAGWLASHIQMFGSFFGALHQHAFNTSVDITGCDRHALLIYQADDRRAWHQALHAQATAFDLSIINDQMLRAARDKAFQQHQNRTLKAVQLQRFLFLSPHLSLPT
ncbi:hypothetical protein NMY22_g19520 [Coprinellus aureogranulatus]|nr:hypothetical protein NMY22_g19520 [Coprinellus aureogranulatus]